MFNDDGDLKRISFSKTDDYKKRNQFIIGLTFNKEPCSIYDDLMDVTLEFNKYEINLWLGYTGLHITIFGNVTQVKIM